MGVAWESRALPLLFAHSSMHACVLSVLDEAHRRFRTGLQYDTLLRIPASILHRSRVCEGDGGHQDPLSDALERTLIDDRHDGLRAATVVHGRSLRPTTKRIPA